MTARAEHAHPARRLVRPKRDPPRPETDLPDALPRRIQPFPLAVERGLWIPTKAKTPDQSLYGGLYLEMKNSRSPRVKKSAEKGKFELV